MNHFKSLSLAFAFTLVILLPWPINADIAVPTPTVSSRASSSAAQMTTTYSGTLLGGAANGWNPSLGGGTFTFAWNITNPGGAFPYHYIYSLSISPTNRIPFNQSGSTTGVNIQVPSYINGGNLSTYISGITTPFGTVTSVSSIASDTVLRFMPSSASPIIFYIVTFDSILPPVWGDFKVSGFRSAFSTNGTATAQNTQFGNAPTVSDSPFNGWVVVPGNALSVPEPATLLLLGSSLAAAIFARRRAAKKC